MRARVVVVVGVVAVLVLALGWVVVGRVQDSRQQALVSRQRATYRIGNAAYLRADCPTALRSLQPAGLDQLDAATIRRAATESAGCQEFQQLDERVAAESPALGAVDDLNYLAEKPAAAMETATRTDARSRLTSAVGTRKVTAELCARQSKLTAAGVLALTSRDTLAPSYLDACARFWATRSEWEQTRTAFLQLIHMFPRTKAARAAPAELARASFAATHGTDKKKFTFPANGLPDSSLRGRTEMVISYSGPDRTEFSTLGPKVTFVQLSRCKGCKEVDRPSYRVCMEHSVTTRMVVPAGGYQVLFRYLDADSASGAPDSVFQGHVALKPDERYEVCMD